MGAVSAAGWGVSALRDRARSGRTAIGPFSRIPHETQRTHVAGQVPPPPPSAGWLARWSRYSHADRFAIFASAEAVDQALLGEAIQNQIAGVYFASSTSGLFETECFYERLHGQGAEPAPRSLLTSHHLSAPAETIARRLGVSGPVETFSSACASAGLAIEQALQSVRSGEVDLAIAGGADGLALTTYSGFNALRAMDEQPCRPFRATRAGMSLGEGAGVLVLEPLDRALARGVVPLAEIVGAGASCDASHMTAPHETGAFAAAAMLAAIADAGLSPDDVDYINAHATGTPLNDAAEFAAMRLVFGDRASRIPVEATKSMLGHLLGAAGAIEAVSTILCLLDRSVNPTAGEGDLDPATPVTLVSNRPMASDIRYAISPSLGFGGANAAVLFGRWNPS
jgi:3-oxoacyl-[acyl-carrier-protein] synthase II